MNSVSSSYSVIHGIAPELSPIALSLVALARFDDRLLRPARSGAQLLVGASCDWTRSRPEFVIENALLRQQLIVLRRGSGRPAVHRDDRLILLSLARMTRCWRGALHLVSPDTLLRWHRGLYRLFWRRKSRPRSPPKRLAPGGC